MLHMHEMHRCNQEGSLEIAFLPGPTLIPLDCSALRSGKVKRGLCCLQELTRASPVLIGAGEGSPTATIWPANLFRRGGEDALLQAEGLRGQRAPQLVPRQAGLELQQARGHEQPVSVAPGPAPPQPASPPTLCTASSVFSGLLRYACATSLIGKGIDLRV